MKQFKDFVEEAADPEVAATYKRIATQHLKDMMAKNASNSSKIYSKKMHQRALEASKMSNHTDALNHYRGVKEEVEQVDELNRKTLASYVSKAAGSYGRDKQLIGRTSSDGTVKNADPDLKRAVKNRLTGINRAAERLAKEEAEQLVAEVKRSDRYHIVGKDGKPANLASYADKASAIKDRDEKYPNADVHQVGPRGKVKGVVKGVAEASDDELNARPGMWRGNAKRMTAKGKPTKDELGMQDNLKNRIKASNKKGGLTGPKGPLPEEQGVAEEIEQIDELSPELMRRAADKYQDKINRSKHPAETDKLLDKQARMSGQARRTELGKRYNKEEVEQIDEISQATKDSYSKKAKAEVDELKSHVKGEYGGIVKRMMARRKKGLKLAQKKTSE